MGREMRKQPTEAPPEVGWEGLPREQRRFLWTQRNHSRRRQPMSLGEIASKYVVDSVTRRSKRLAKVTEAWVNAVPGSLQALTDIGSLRRGCLEVLVDSPATQYVLSRRHEMELLEALRTALPGMGLQRIRYRIAPHELPSWQERPN